MEEEKKTEQTPAPDSSKSGCLAAIVFVVILVGIVMVVFTLAKAQAEGKINEGHISSITKTEPSVTSDNTLTGIKINVYANDNYSEVCIKIVLYDRNKAILKEENLVGNNYKKGNTYALMYNFTASEMITVSYTQYRILYYK